MVYRVASLILGLIIGFYWGRVIRMARKARKRTGRAANFFPPEPIGRVLRILWIPVVVIWIVHPFVTAHAILHWLILTPLWHSPWIACPAVVIAFACLWLSQICWRTMGKNWRMGIDPVERTSLVSEGPYAYVRHPIYALSQAMMLATVIAIPSPLMIAAGAFHIALLQWEARREESHMTTVHGQTYLDYCARVRRFLPLR
jgi:protein-S-isoprenylcysteine O-methyltransferase Ste14